MKIIINTLLMGLLFVSMTGCKFGGGSGGTTTGNPIVQLKLSSFNQAQANKLAQLMNVEVQNVSTIVMCFKRLRFKKEGELTDANPDLDNDNIDLDLGEVEINSMGTNLTSVSIEAGTYTRVEFDLEKDCSSGSSIQFVNDNGTFNTDERITIKFEGQFIANSNYEELNLGVQTIIDAMDSIVSNADIKSTLESVSGDI